jgi:hypothetical protein
MTPSSKRLLALASAAALVFASALPTFAQTAALGSIGGIVRDPSGAVVAGAAVVITDTQTGASRTITTDSEGHYAADFLQPGPYEVVLGGGSFGKVDRKNVPVTVGAPTTVDAVLPAASVSTDVTVTSDPPLLDTEKVEESQVVDQQIVSNVPVNSRRFESFVLLTPNVIPDGNTGLIGYRGISGVYNSNIVDGANNNQQFFSEARGRSIGAPYVFPVDAVREFESSATGYSAELGGSAGGIINAVTKSGGNQIHGDAYEYYRTPGWNALDPYNKFQGRSATTPVAAQTFLSQPVKVQHEYGISVGGPIIKDKLFFHFTYDGFRKTNPIVYTSSFNTSNQVAALIHLCDGGTTNLKDGATVYPTTIPNVTPAQCAAGVAAIQTQLGAFQRNVKQDIFFPRLDYQLGSRTHLSSEFLWQDFHQPDGYNTSVTVNNGGVSNNGTANFHERILIANAETVLTSHSANVVHFQWARDLETDTTNTGGPFNSLSNLASIGETSALPRGKFPDEHRWQGTDIYSTTFGRHSLKVGFDLNFVHEQISNLFGGDGSFSYTNANAEYNFTNFLQDALGVNPTLTAGAAGISRHYNSFSQTVDQLTGVGADDFWNQNVDFFVEDAWKVSPKLLLSLGLRYDVQLVPGPDLPNTANAAAFNATSQINPDLHMIQPRIGFNWNPYPGTVVRGGYGFFYGQISNSSYYTLRRENGVYQKQYGPISAVTYSGAGLGGATVTYGTPVPYIAATTATSPTLITGAGTVPGPCVPVAPATVCFTNPGNYTSYAPQGGVPIYPPPGPSPVNPVTGAPITSTGLAAVPTGTITIRGLDPSFTNPLSQSYDLTVEQQLPGRSTLTVGYVGNRATHLPVYIDTNVDPASVTTTHTYQYTAPGTGAAVNYAQPIYTNRLYTTTGTVATGFSVLDSWYNSMVVTVHKPMSHGVELLANYTWAKALDNGQTYGGNGTFNGTDAPLNPFRLGGRNGINDEYSRSDLDIRGRLVATVIGKSQFSIPNKLVAYGVNGWQLSGTLTAQDGEPVTATINGSITYLTGGSLGNLTTDAGVSNAAFTSGPSARVPDFIAARNGFRGPGVHNVDARLSREFPIFGDRYHVELAADAFNIANHRNILSVNTALVAYSAPGASYLPLGSTVSQVCPAASTGNVGCLGALSSSTAAFMTPASTSNIIYGSRQLQLLARFIF